MAGSWEEIVASAAGLAGSQGLAQTHHRCLACRRISYCPPGGCPTCGGQVVRMVWPEIKLPRMSDGTIEALPLPEGWERV